MTGEFATDVFWRVRARFGSNMEQRAVKGNYLCCQATGLNEQQASERCMEGASEITRTINDALAKRWSIAYCSSGGGGVAT